MHRYRVWSYSFVTYRSHDGRTSKMLTVIDESTRQCLAIVVNRRITCSDVLYCMAGLFLLHDVPEHIRSETRPDFTAK